MDYISFASGSSGNCALLRGGGVNLLIDAGISMKRIRLSLRSLGLDLGDLRGVLVTHEHSDHVSALPMLSKYTDLPVYLSPGTGEALLRDGKCARKNLRPLGEDLSLSLGELRILGVPLMHDAAQPIGWRIEGEKSAVAVLTDLGKLTEEVRAAARGCRFAVVECNHDVEMLRRGPYPPALQRRILGDRGHLSNEAGAELASVLAEAGAEEVLLGHLSRENNRPELALAAVRNRVGSDLRVSAALRDACSPRIRVE
jgi:phosphoribosyl 1,2-cyclic phosphodiesterase